jgi:hypothetical protein
LEEVRHEFHKSTLIIKTIIFGDEAGKEESGISKADLAD